VAIISGGYWPQFQQQVLSHLGVTQHLSNLTILPTCGTKFYQYRSGWTKIYMEDFTKDETNKIIPNLTDSVEESGFKAVKTWRKLTENRGGQITY